MRQGFPIGLSQQHIEFLDEKRPFSRRSSVNYLLLELESCEMFDIASTSMELFVGDSRISIMSFNSYCVIA